MDDVHHGSELTLAELEALLFEKRRQASEHRVSRISSAERTPRIRTYLNQPESGIIKPGRAPETWRGAANQDRYFRPMRPVSFAASTHWLLPRTASEAVKVVIRARSSPRHLGDYLLLGVEALGLAAVILILFLSVRQLRDLNREMRATQTQSVALLPQVVPEPELVPPPAQQMLPGVRPETSAAAIQTAEIDLASPPTPQIGAAQRLVIPKINVDSPIVQGDTWEDLKKGIGQHAGSAMPGEPDNMVVSAHNDIYGEIFRDLDKLEVGDEVLVYSAAGAYRYVVNSVEIVAPTQVQVMEPTGYGLLTLITCYPYLLDTHRVVVQADLAD